jgi:hypothetical protein
MREDTDEPLPSESEKTTWLAMAAGERRRQAGAAGSAGGEGAAGGGVGGRALSLSLSLSPSLLIEKYILIHSLGKSCRVGLVGRF